jgi:hypothetical protein
MPVGEAMMKRVQEVIDKLKSSAWIRIPYLSAIETR